jgi:hypothetical protein
MHRRVLPFAIVLGALAVPAIAAARPTAPTSKTLVAGSAPVVSCGDLSGVVTNFTISSGSVTVVSLSNVPTTCDGATVNLNLTNAGTNLAAGGPVVVASGAAAVPISPSVPTGSVTHVRLVMTGP